MALRLAPGRTGRAVGVAWPPAGGAGGLQGARSQGARAKMPFVFPIREHGARDWCTRVWACSTRPRHGVRHTGSRGTPWGCEHEQDRQPSPPISDVRGDRRRRTRRRLLAPTSLREQGRVGDPSGAVRQRPTRRLPVGHALGQSSAPPPAARAAAPAAPVAGVQRLLPEAARQNSG